MVCVWVRVQNVTKRVRVWEKRATLAFFWRRGRCASAGAQQTAGWRWRCGHRPHSLCDVLWHTDGSWHNTDRLSLRPLAPTLTPPPSSPLQNGCFLSCWRSTRFYLSPDLIDIQIDAKDIVTTLLFPGFFHFLLPTPPLLSHISHPLFCHPRPRCDPAKVREKRFWMGFSQICKEAGCHGWMIPNEHPQSLSAAPFVKNSQHAPHMCSRICFKNERSADNLNCPLFSSPSPLYYRVVFVVLWRFPPT